MITSVRRNAFADATGATVDPVTGPAAPTTPRTRAALPTTSLGRDEFLKLLVAQLRNQDPLNPMDGKDMAAQLAQFSSVEQLLKLNDSFDTQTAAQKAIADSIAALQEEQKAANADLTSLIEGQTALATVGKTAVTNGNDMFVDHNGKGTVLIDTGTLTGGAVVTATGPNGETHTAGISRVTAGQSAFEASELGFEPPLKAGKYTYNVKVATDGGPYQSVKTYTTGRITGMRYEHGNPILIIGDTLSLPMSKLTQIRS